MRTLLHPRMVMVVLSMLSVFVGLNTLEYEAGYLHYPALWGWVAIVAGGIGTFASAHPGRTVVALSGASLIVAPLARAAALFETILRSDQTPSVRASFEIATAQWTVLAFVTWVLWKRVVVPWSVLEQQRRVLHG